MAKTGFEKFAEKNRMPEIKIGRPAVAETEQAIGSKAAEQGSARARGAHRPDEKKKTHVLLCVDTDLKEKLLRVKEETYSVSLNALIVHILSDYVSEYEKNR